MNLLEKLESKIFIAPDGCWIWTSYINESGYGRTTIDKKTLLVHRVIYEIYKNTIPAGMVTDHLCRKRSCVNPHHLEIVTPAENTRRGLKTKRICEHGNGFSRCINGCGDKYKKQYRDMYYQKNKIELNKKRVERYYKEKGK